MFCYRTVFSNFPGSCRLPDSFPQPPTRQRLPLTHWWVWAVPRSLAATEGISVDFYSCRYLDVSVPCVRALQRLIGSFGYPIRKSTDWRLRTATRGLSQLITSFVASRCQGIHHLLFVACSPYCLLVITSRLQQRPATGPARRNLEPLQISGRRRGIASSAIHRHSPFACVIIASPLVAALSFDAAATILDAVTRSRRFRRPFARPRVTRRVALTSREMPLTCVCRASSEHYLWKPDAWPCGSTSVDLS